MKRPFLQNLEEGPLIQAHSAESQHNNTVVAVSLKNPPNIWYSFIQLTLWAPLFCFACTSIMASFA